MDKSYSPAKMTITYLDGHTEDFDTFIAAAATGLTAVGKDNRGALSYIAEDGKATFRSLMCVSGSTEVAAGLIDNLRQLVNNICESLGPEGAAELCAALVRLQVETSIEIKTNETDISFKKIDISGN